MLVLKEGLRFLQFDFNDLIVLLEFEVLPEGLVAVRGHDQMNRSLRDVNELVPPLRVCLGTVREPLVAFEFPWLVEAERQVSVGERLVGGRILH